MSRWWRAYEDAVDDPKLQRMSGELFKAWFNLLCLASRHGGQLPSVEDIAFSLRKSVAQVAALIETLRQRALLDEVDGRIEPHNWRTRQFKSDVSTQRVKAFRFRQRNVSPAVAQTPPETEADADTETEPEQSRSSLRVDARVGGDKPAAQRATRISAEWTPSPDDLAAARREGLSETDARRESAKFRDYFLAKAGKDAARLDWSATWRNWCRRAAEQLGRSPPPDRAAAVDQFYAAADTAQLEAWDRHFRQTRGKGLPRDRNGGWLVDTEWPPGHAANAEPAPAHPRATN
jgi:hypothetical protein